MALPPPPLQLPPREALGNPRAAAGSAARPGTAIPGHGQVPAELRGKGRRWDLRARVKDKRDQVNQQTTCCFPPALSALGDHELRSLRSLGTRFSLRMGGCGTVGSCSQRGRWHSPSWVLGPCAPMVQASHKDSSSSTSHPTQSPMRSSSLKKEPSARVHMVERLIPATLTHVLPPARPAQGLGEPNPRRGKASQPARPAPNKPPRLCRADAPGSSLQPRDQRMLFPASQALGQGLCWTGRTPPCHLGSGRTAHWAGRTRRAAQPHFLVQSSQVSGLGGSLMSVPGRQLMETGHGAHPDTASPGRGPAPVTPSHRALR